MILNLDGKDFEWVPHQLIVAGYTGRNQDAVKKHVEELKKIGVPAPPNIPMIYHVSENLITTNNKISVVKRESSGEAEIVLANVNKKWYIGLGSDHTDRILESTSVQKSKQICCKPISRCFWSLDSVALNLDEYYIKSWVIDHGKKMLYQEGYLDNLLKPETLINLLSNRGFSLNNIMIFGGTLPIKGGKFIFGDRFVAVLENSSNDKKIELDYQINFLADDEPTE
ncbi:DUF2848 family protein [Sporolactobacillus vineae]|uniref:DUF2848 family protein n=1 Tax=Sporolactobacillus vineae TaxID=444463 RepID=UPI00028A149A|nr:DUF2848 family protein [Sporolactobacillus vineae]